MIIFINIDKKYKGIYNVSRGDFMPYIYLSKVNLNSKIYEVYDKKIHLSDVLDEIFIRLGDEKKYEKEIVRTYDTNEGKKKSIVKEKYCFNSLVKDYDNRVIEGNIVRMYPHYLEKFHEDTKKITNTKVEESSSIYFYFDVDKEYIGFCTRTKFGYNQFNEAFKNLLEMHMNEYGFEVFLKKDKEKFTKELEGFERVNKVVATLIPPNANDDEIEELKSDSEVVSYKEANITKAKVEYSVSKLSEDGLNMQAQLLKQAVKQVSLGYGDMNVHGIKGGKEHVVRSNCEGVLTSYISEEDNSNKITFKDAVRNLILRAIRV